MTTMGIGIKREKREKKRERERESEPLIWEKKRTHGERHHAAMT